MGYAPLLWAPRRRFDPSSSPSASSQIKAEQPSLDQIRELVGIGIVPPPGTTDGP